MDSLKRVARNTAKGAYYLGAGSVKLTGRVLFGGTAACAVPAVVDTFKRGVTPLRNTFDQIIEAAKIDTRLFWDIFSNNFSEVFTSVWNGNLGNVPAGVVTGCVVGLLWQLESWSTGRSLRTVKGQHEAEVVKHAEAREKISQLTEALEKTTYGDMQKEIGLVQQQRDEAMETAAQARNLHWEASEYIAEQAQRLNEAVKELEVEKERHKETIEKVGSAVAKIQAEEAAHGLTREELTRVQQQHQETSQNAAQLAEELKRMIDQLQTEKGDHAQTRARIKELEQQFEGAVDKIQSEPEVPPLKAEPTGDVITNQLKQHLNEMQERAERAEGILADRNLFKEELAQLIAESEQDARYL